MPRTTAPASAEAMPNEPLEVARRVFFEVDDVLGRLKNAIRVIEHLTEGELANCALDLLVDRHKELEKLIYDAWPVVIAGDKSKGLRAVA